MNLLNSLTGWQQHLVSSLRETTTRYRNAAARLAAALLLASLYLPAVNADTQQPEPLRKPASISDPAVVAPLPAKPMAEPKTGSLPRRHPQQPPLVPHSVRDHQIHLNANHCLHCHAPAGKVSPATRAPAPDISLSHYVDRQGNPSEFLDGRRYFCLQCHVPQYRSEPLIETDFLQSIQREEP